MDYITVKMTGEKSRMSKLMKMIGNMKARVVHAKIVKNEEVGDTYDVAFMVSSRKFGKAVRKLSKLGDVIVS